MPDPSPPGPGKKPVLPVGTRLESVEDIRKARKVERTPTLREIAIPPDDATPFRPTRRPPMALLCIVDDGKEDGQWRRLREDKIVIGRGEGDIIIPHDTMISSRHAELTRELEDGQYRWYLNDLQSTNGTYVRIGNALMKHGQELLIGSRRYRFEIPTVSPESVETQAHNIEESVRGTTRWPSVSPTQLFPSLVELTAQGDGRRFPLMKEENLIGRRTQSADVALADDPLVSPQHARLYSDKKGRWHIENTKAINGTWLRIERMAIDPTGQFQIGEQRFLLKVL
jgi:pSer/pThr/pTyr-binding forkhead associated (FHA) protein